MTEIRARVVLGATCYAEARSALTVGLRIASRFDGELRGLLIEEEAVLAVARRPGARIITPGGRRISGIGAESMAAAFLRDAERFERELAAAAGALPLRWSFARRAGRMAAILSEAMSAADFLILGGAPLGPEPGGVVYLAGPHTDPELEDIAADLAGELHRPLRVILQDPAAAAPARLAAGQVVISPSAEALRELIALLTADSILVANLANAPVGLTEVLSPARFTRILRSEAPPTRSEGP